MIQIILFMVYIGGLSFIFGVFRFEWESRPTLQSFGYDLGAEQRGYSLQDLVRSLSFINKPLVFGTMRQRIARDLARGHVNMTPEEFFFWKEISIVVLLLLFYPAIKADMVIFWILMCLAAGYMLPEYILRSKINKVKNQITKELPDAIDLLGLCVNAGLDFMLALKWVVEKSTPSVMTNELNILLKEINVGKTRRDALKDLAAKYNIPDISTFSRTLIQADKMGTSVSEALNQLSEDMRLARFRRGEKMAMKAPLKLLVPLLFCIFPVVGILVAGPIFIQFLENNPMEQMKI